MPTKDVTLAEAVVAPGSRLIGRTIEQAAIHHDTGTVVLGVERRSRMPRMALSDIRLEAGDVLLIGGTRETIEGLRANRDLLLLEWSAIDVPQRRYANRARIIFALLVIYAASGVGPIVIGALDRRARHGARRLPQCASGGAFLRPDDLSDDRGLARGCSGARGDRRGALHRRPRRSMRSAAIRPASRCR